MKKGIVSEATYTGTVEESVTFTSPLRSSEFVKFKDLALGLLAVPKGEIDANYAAAAAAADEAD